MITSGLTLTYSFCLVTVFPFEHSPHSKRIVPPSDRVISSLYKLTFLKKFMIGSTGMNRIACQCPLKAKVQGLYTYITSLYIRIFYHLRELCVFHDVNKQFGGRLEIEFCLLCLVVAADPSEYENT